MGVGGQRHAPAALPPGMTRHPLYRRLGRPQGRSGRVLKISLPPGLDSRIVLFVSVIMVYFYTYICIYCIIFVAHFATFHVLSISDSAIVSVVGQMAFHKVESKGKKIMA
jgi:hypothetical protein